MIATVAALVGIVTGLVTLGTQLLSADSGKGSGAAPLASRDIPRYDGIAGHFAEGRALLDFLKQYDRQSVYLDVGFPALATGPAGGDNVFTRTEPFRAGTRSLLTQIDLMTECRSNAVPRSGNPTTADGCMATALVIDGAGTRDAQTFFEHGVPRIKGYFRVDVTGALYQGESPINLRPLTLDQARRT